MTCSTTIKYRSDLYDAQVTKRNLVTACFAPVALYIIAYGHSSHFIALFGIIVVIRVAFNLDLLSILKTVDGSSVPTSPRPAVPRPDQVKVGVTSCRNRVSPKFKPINVPPPTCIKSLDCPLTKLRRGIVNKVCPEKLDELVAKILATFNLHASEDSRRIDFEQFLELVFAAASRQPLYVSVFTEFMRRVSDEVLDPESAEDCLVKLCQHHWSATCLSPVEKSRGWALMTPEDQLDTRSRHRAKQLALAELCGLAACRGLIPPAYPLSWIEALLRPVQASLNGHLLPQTASLESALEMICATIRGLGFCEAYGTFTDIDQSRFSSVCDSLHALPLISSRSRCLLQDLFELRQSGWTKSADWKQALIPRKRISM